MYVNFRTDFCAQISLKISLNSRSVPSACYTFIKIQCGYVTSVRIVQGASQLNKNNIVSAIAQFY